MADAPPTTKRVRWARVATICPPRSRRPQAQVDQPVGRADGGLVMLDHHEAVPLVTELYQAREEFAGITGMPGRRSVRRGCSKNADQP